MTEPRINVATSEGIELDLEVAAKVLNMEVSSLINFIVVRAVVEARTYDPETFRLTKDEICLARREARLKIEPGVVKHTPTLGEMKDETPREIKKTGTK